ncbi:TPA: helix-turn-helix domain-containing protein [Clostridioides difficile]
MNGMNGNETGYPEKALIPYSVIVAATKGDPDAMKIVLQHFSGYIARLSMRKLYDERGNVYFGVDNDIRERLQAKLMMAVLNFRTEE